MINKVHGNYSIAHNTIKSYNCTKNNSKNKLMEALEKSKEILEEQKEKIKQENLSPEEILEKNKEIDDEINNINSQIDQILLKTKEIEAEKLNEDIKKRQEEEKLRNKNEEEIDGVIVSESLSCLIKNNSVQKTISGLKELKSRYKNSSPDIAKRIDATIGEKIKRVNKNLKENLEFIQKSKEADKEK